MLLINNLRNKKKGRLVSENVTLFKFPNFTSVVAPGNSVVYRIQYLGVPVGIKLKTNEIGFLTHFADITKDTGEQLDDRTVHKFLKFVFGVNF